MSTQQRVFLGIGFVLLIVLLWQLLWLATLATARLFERMRARRPGAGMWARTHPLRARLAARYPRGHDFLGKRLDPRRPSGLPLTLGIAAALYVLSLIGGLVEELLEAQEMIALDRTINMQLDAFRSAPFLEIFAWITTLGSSGTLVAVTLTSTGFLWAHERTHYILPLWVTQLGAQATTYLGKFALNRERPDFLTDVTALTPSFPSGHATSAMAVYGFLAYLIARDLPGVRARFELVYWSAVLILLVGFSRMYLSVHYASDVATGFLVGGFWLLVGVVLAEHRRFHWMQR